MILVGARGQIGTRDLTYRADGTIASATLPQLLLPESLKRSFFEFQNTTAAAMWLEFGSARAHATISGGKVTSVTVDNAGFNFTLPPLIEFLGGGQDGGAGGQTNTAFIAAGQPDYPAPFHPAQAHCVLTTGAVSSIVVDDGGSGYTVAPYVRITNHPLDLNGAADPSVGSGSGLKLTAGQIIKYDAISCPTDQIALFCATISSPFFCRWL